MAGQHQHRELLPTQDEEILLIEEDDILLIEDEDEDEDEGDILFVEDDDISLANDENREKPETVQDATRIVPWQVLIVDDEPAVHQATQLALTNFRFRDRPLSLFHAYSGAEAKALLREQPNISFLLLDVVMESNDAGLEVVKYIRDVLGNRRIQIILRTGQPGEAPETSIIQEYEINDYKLKTELTRQRLITTVTTALRSYCNVVAAEEKTIELEHALNQLQQTQIQLVHSEKMSALGNLVASVAHEINNPVSCIMGNVNILERYINTLFGGIEMYAQQYPEPDSAFEKQLDTLELDYVRDDLPDVMRALKNSGDRIIAISKSLCTFSRADTEAKQAFNLHDGLESTILILRHRLKANGHRPAIKVMTDYSDIPNVPCFPGQINQVFMNILANAIDALDEVSQTLNFDELELNPQHITIRTGLEQNWVKVTIADNGSGISMAVKPKIFDYLFTTKKIGKGTGLGLAIARQIVEDGHGGTLELCSNVSQETAFCIRLPLH